MRFIDPRHKLDVMGFDQISEFLGSREELDALIEWRARSPAVLRKYKTATVLEGAYMQMQLTIELRVDFADRDKLPELKQSALIAARHLYATAQLISDTPKTTQIAVYADDFFSKPEEIKILDDLIAKGIAETHSEDQEDMGNISADLVAAVTEVSQIRKE